MFYTSHQNSVDEFTLKSLSNHIVKKVPNAKEFVAFKKVLSSENKAFYSSISAEFDFAYIHSFNVSQTDFIDSINECIKKLYSNYNTFDSLNEKFKKGIDISGDLNQFLMEQYSAIAFHSRSIPRMSSSTFQDIFDIVRKSCDPYISLADLNIYVRNLCVKS